MNLEDIIIVDRKEWRVAIINDTYAGLELVSNPKITRMIRVDKLVEQ